MAWLAVIAGLIIGIILSDERWMLGASAGAFIAWLMVKISRLESRLRELEQRPLRELVTPRPQEAPSRAVAPSPNINQAPPAVAIQDSPINAAPSAASEDMPAASAAIDGPSNAGPPPLPAATAPLSARTQAVLASRRTSTQEPQEPDVISRLLGTLKSWLFEGNVPVKVGVLVLFFGVAALIRYAVAEGYLSFPIQYRLGGIALGCVAALAFAWRVRAQKPAFSLALQGGALGILLMVVFASFKPFQLLPAGMAFGLVVAIVAGCTLLAVLQRAQWLAALGFLGGYLAPVLISTGSGNHVALFSYYAVLNAAVFLIAWKHPWRLLNLIGFLFTFGIGTLWGAKYYRPELFGTVEPFLILFFLFYLGIGWLYATKQTEHAQPWVDGTLVFGTPLVAFPLQARLMAENDMGLAISAVVIALAYVAMMWSIRRRDDLKLLMRSYAALAVGFVTLAIPLAFSARATATLWALEGAGVAWIGLKQNRKLPWFTGLALQLLAAGAYVKSLLDSSHVSTETVLMNAHWLGAAMLAVAGLLISWMHERAGKMAIAWLAVCWALFWWVVGGVHELELQFDGQREWMFSALYVSLTAALAALLAWRLDWRSLRLWPVACLAAGLFLIGAWREGAVYPVDASNALGWAVYFTAGAVVLLALREQRDFWLAAAHWVVLAALTLLLVAQAYAWSQQWLLADGWRFAARVAPLLGVLALLVFAPRLAEWPVRGASEGHLRPAPLVIASVLGLLWFLGVLMAGDASPLPFVPIINPLELVLIAIAFLIWRAWRDRTPDDAWNRVALFIGFIFLNSALLRAVHHLHGDPWSIALWSSSFAQAAITLLWSVIGLAAMVIGSRRADRQIWLGGAALMGVVLGKLLLVDRMFMGNMPGIVSFIGVGLLLLVIGYFSPSPPRKEEQGESA